MKKIMIVDDIEISNFIMKKMISMTSYESQVFEYISPLKALADIAPVDPHAIFLDLNMPDIDGWEFLKIMAETNLEHDVYILTSSTNELDLQRSKNYKNVKDFLVKPLAINTLDGLLKSI